MSDLIELGKRAVACKHWQWMNGMRTICGARLVGDLDSAAGYMLSDDADRVARTDDEDADEYLPDLSDPATLGCLLHLVFEACGRGMGMRIQNDGLNNEAECYVDCLENADDRRAKLEALGWVNE